MSFPADTEVPAPGKFVGRCMAVPTHPAPEALIKLTESGCRYFELIIGGPGHFDAMTHTQVRLLKRIMSATGAVLLTVHCDFSPPAQIDQPDRHAREAALLTQRCGILFAAEMGARFYILHPSNYSGQPERQMRLDIAADSYAHLAEFAASQGVTAAMENMLGEHIASHEDELIHIVDRADAPSGICFDTGHAHLVKRLPELARALLARTVTTHMHDNDGLEDRHWFPGTGSIDWAAFGRAYRESGSKALLMVESYQIVHPTWPQSEDSILSLMQMPRPA